MSLQNHPNLIDEDVLFVYDKLYQFYKKCGAGGDPAEPTSTIRRKQELLENILKKLEVRYEEGMDERLINSDYRPAGYAFGNEDALYAHALNYLRASLKRWKKREGKRGYVTFLRSQLRPDISGGED